VLLCLALIAFHLRAGFIPGWKDVNSDFPNYYVASRLAAEGRNLDSIYDNAWFNAEIRKRGMEQEGKFTPFPPSTLALMLPFVSLEPLTAKRIWLVINLFFIVALAAMIRKITGLSAWWSLNLLLLSGMALANNLYLGQVYVLMLFLAFLAWTRSAMASGTVSGFLLGTAAAVKYFPVVFLLKYLAERKWKALLFFLAGILLLSLLPLLFHPGIYRDFFQAVFVPHLAGSIEGQSFFAWQFQSWNSLLGNLFLENPEGSQIMDSHAGFLLSKVFIHMFIAGSALYSLFRFRKNPLFSDWVIVVVPAAALALLPASATYHFLFLLLPLVLLINMLRQAQRDSAMIVTAGLFSLIGFAPFLLERFVDMEEVFFLFRYSRLYLVTAFFFWTLWSGNLILRSRFQ